MKFKWTFVPIMALCVLGAALPVRSQVTYSAEEGKLPFTVGVGFSNFSDDWGVQNPRQDGITLWADWRVPGLPGPLSRLEGLGIEFEGRDINYGTPSSIPGHRMDTALGGPTYEWRRAGRIRPFAKYLVGIGSIDFPNGTNYQHDTRTVYEPGGGVDLRCWSRFSARVEYDYQYWHQIFGPRDLTPNGVSVGVVYDFGMRPTR